MGTRDAIETPSAALEALPEPYNFASQTMLQVKLNCYDFLENYLVRKFFIILITKYYYNCVTSSKSIVYNSNLIKVIVRFAHMRVLVMY